MSKDSFTTASGRKVDLHIYVQQQNIDRVAYAMQSLKAAMKWDEDVFGEASMHICFAGDRFKHPVLKGALAGSAWEALVWFEEGG